MHHPIMITSVEFIFYKYLNRYGAVRTVEWQINYLIWFDMSCFVWPVLYVLFCMTYFVFPVLYDLFCMSCFVCPGSSCFVSPGLYVQFCMTCFIFRNGMKTEPCLYPNPVFYQQTAPPSYLSNPHAPPDYDYSTCVEFYICYKYLNMYGAVWTVEWQINYLIWFDMSCFICPILYGTGSVVL